MLREYTCKILQMLDEGYLEPKQLVIDLLNWLDEGNVQEFYQTYFDENENDDDESEDDENDENEVFSDEPDESQEWEDFDPDC